MKKKLKKERENKDKEESKKNEQVLKEIRKINKALKVDSLTFV